MRIYSPALWAGALLAGAGLMAFPQENSGPFKPLPKLVDTAHPRSASPRAQTDARTNNGAWMRLPQVEPGGPPVASDAALTEKTRVAERQLWENMTNAVFQTQFQQTLLLLKIANQQAEVRTKVEAARQAVHDYVRDHSPEMLPVLEKMCAPRDLQRRNGQLTELIY